MDRLPLFDTELDALKRVLESRILSGYRASSQTGGFFVEQLEYAFCDFFNIKHAVAMNSATSCLIAACIACETKVASVPVITFSATASSVLHAGGAVQFSDINPLTYNMINPPECDTIIPVHLHGNPVNLDKLCKVKYGKIKVIEDASQAILAKYKSRWVGTLGDCGVFSFNQSKQMTCGEGGILITNDDKIAEVCRLVRNHGETQSNILGYNFRMTELEAAIAYEQFKKLPGWIERRIELAEYLTEKIKNYVRTPTILEGCRHSYYTYPIWISKRDELQTKLLQEGIYFGQGGQRPLNKIPFYQDGKSYPNAEDYEKYVMFTDIIRPQATFKDMDRIAYGIIKRDD